MAIVVLVSLAVSILFVPAVMGLLGRAAFWPGLSDDRLDPLLTRIGARARRTVAAGTSRRLGAVPMLAVAAVALVFAATGLARLTLALTPIRGLARDAPAAVADREAARGFAAGIVAPTELVVRAHDIGFRRKALERFGRSLYAQPGVGAVIGAALPNVPRRARTVFRAPDGGRGSLLPGLRPPSRTARLGSTTCAGSRRRCRVCWPLPGWAARGRPTRVIRRWPPRRPI